MQNFKFEYIWLDGYLPEANLRSKTKVLTFESYDGALDVLPHWSFDGSSTKQADGHSSDCLLKPVRVYLDPARVNGYLVMCEVMNPDGTPHATNTRSTIKNDSDEIWFGYEQEYTLVDGGRPLGFPTNGYPAPQGLYYCSVGSGRVSGRDIVEDHFDMCLDAGLTITGINAEVMLGQWEFQCMSKSAKKAGDDLWIARYLMYRVSEDYNLHVEYAPKPVKGDWNGSGCHANFSNTRMRTVGGKDYFTAICDKFGERHNEHIAGYGHDNDQRLTGLHETQSIDKFSYGISDRGASIRIPISTSEDWKGYLEDRRPASNMDPYIVGSLIVETLSMVD